MFEKFSESHPWTIAIVVVLLAVGVVGTILLLRRQKTRSASAPAKKGWTPAQMVTGAMCIAISFVLSYIRLVHMPQGGSITPASMLPIMLFAYLYGTPKGLVVGFA